MCKIFRLLTALLFATGLLVACGGGSSSGAASGSSSLPSLPRSPAQGSVTSKTTVLVYMIGADLESIYGSASGNIKEMMAVGSTGNMNVIIQTGGADRGVGSAEEIKLNPARVIDWTKVQRYLVQRGQLLQILPDLGPDAKDTAFDMGSKATLQSFLKWGVETYKADKYIVVLWDHGGGINGGIGQDQITKGILTVPVIQESLQAVSQAQNPVIKFEMVGFDACLMANAEVAASLANSTKYMVASQDLEPGAGWAWDRFLKFVTDNPAATGKEIGTAIADSYLYKMNIDDATVTLSVTDLSKMAALSAATDGFATALQKYVADTTGTLNAWKQIAFARAKSLDWYTAPMMGQSTDLVDMAIFPANVVTNINKFVGVDQPLMDASDDLYKALSAAVVYKVQNGSNLGASGLSIYFPSILTAYVDGNHEYASNTMSDGTAPFASKYTNGTTGLVKNYYDFYEANKDKLKAIVTKDSTSDKHYAAQIINDFAMVLSAHQAKDCQINRDPSTPLVLETVDCFDAMQLNENSTYDATTGQWGVDFTGTKNWFLIGDPAYTVAMIPDQVASVSSQIHNRSLVPAYYYQEKNKKWIPGVLLFEEYVPDDASTTAFRVLGFQGGTPGSSSNPERFYRIQDNERFALGAYYYEFSSFHYAFGRTNREVTASGGTLKLKRGSITSGGNFGYIVTDLAGNLSVPSTFELVNYQN